MKKYFLLYKMLFLSIAAFPQLNIGTGANFKTTGDVSIVLNDLDLENNGNLIQSSGSVKFSGTQNSFIKGNNMPIISILEVNKTNNSKLLLNYQVNIGHSINFISGLLDLNGNNILMDGAAFIAGESESNRIVGPDGGYVEISQLLNAPFNANPGNLGATITSNANMGIVTIRRGHTPQSGTGLTSSIARHYDIKPTSNNDLDATLRIKYFDAELNGQNEDQLVIWQFNPFFDGTNWQNLSQSGRDATGNYVQRAGISNFYLQTLANDHLITGDYIINDATKSSNVKAVNTKPSSIPIQKKITIGPNPNMGNFWFNVNGIEKETIATLYTIDGKQIKQFRIVDLQQQQVSGMRTGIYLLMIPGFETQKIIVNGGGNRTQDPRQILNNNTKQ